MQFRQDFNVIRLIYRLAAGTHSAITIPWISMKTIDMALNFERLMHAFLVLEMMLTSTALIVAWFPDHT